MSRRKRANGGISGALCLLLMLAVTLSAHAGEWQTVGKMTEARFEPTVTLLTDGTVLIAGGRGRSKLRASLQPLRTAERFDPKTNTFTPVGQMSVAVWHRPKAVLLQDGRVLVVGGTNRVANLFDPATNSFTRTGRMLYEHNAGTATLLPNGQVLLAGGWGENRAELFDPTTGAFQETGTMAVRRGRAAAVALPDGRVAILGGTDPRSNRIHRSVEIYDPATGTFTLQGQLVRSRDTPSVTLLPDGRILVVGGAGEGLRSRQSIEIYDPATGKSEVIDPGNRTSPTRGFTGLLVPLQDGRILIAGGFWLGPFVAARRDDIAVRAAELFDPATGELSPVAPMSVGRGAVGALRLADGRVLVVGGWVPPEGSNGPTDLAEVYVP